MTHPVVTDCLIVQTAGVNLLSRFAPPYVSLHNRKTFVPASCQLLAAVHHGLPIPHAWQTGGIATSRAVPASM